MKIIRTIDLWTEQYANQYVCFNGAFVDGLNSKEKPFDSYKIIKNCNCLIDTNKGINVSNKHHAIVFYKHENPVRLMVINKNTDIDKCINSALSQYINDCLLKNIFYEFNITKKVVDMKEQSIYNNSDMLNEIDVGSCNRWPLLFSMLKGSYTEDDTQYGNYESNKYEFIPKILLSYKLQTDTEQFIIEHECAFINDIRTRLIPIQKKSKFTK